MDSGNADMPDDRSTRSQVHREEIGPSALVRVAIGAFRQDAHNDINHERGNEALVDTLKHEFPARHKVSPLLNLWIAISRELGIDLWRSILRSSMDLHARIVIRHPERRAFDAPIPTNTAISTIQTRRPA